MLCQLRNTTSVLYSIVVLAYFLASLTATTSAAQEPCRHSVHYPPLVHDNETEPIAANYTFVDNTKRCDALLPVNNSRLPPCSAGDVVVELGTVAVHPNGTNTYPFIRLNVTAASYVPAEQFVVQFKCLYSTNTHDQYCNNQDNLQKRENGEIIWPCRALALEDPEPADSQEPISMSMDCFHLFGLSQYEVNVTLMPQACRNTYVVTIPSYPQVDPSMREWTSIYPGWKSRDLSWWSPLVFVDMNDDEGIFFRYEPPRAFRVKELMFSVYSQSDGVSSFLHKERITAPETSVRWTNVEAGSYYAVVYLDRHDCSMDCKAGSDCTVCPFTMVNFTVPVDKYTPERQRYLAVLGVAKTLALIVFVILIILVISLAAGLFYLRHIRPRQLARRPPQSVELTARPTVLVLYSDDCVEHSNAVMALVHLLEQHANAKVLIDQTAFSDPATRPSVWLMNAITTAQFVLVVFSEATQRIMNGEKLIQRRPFPDQFNTAIRLVVSKINETLSSEAVPVPTTGNNSTSSPLLRPSQRPPNVGTSTSSGLKRYLVARFAYSSPLVVPEFFRLIKCSELLIPDDMGRLIGRLHGIDTEHSSSVELSADLSELQAAISAYKAMVTNKPDFLTERFISQEDADQLDQVVVLPETIPLRPPDKVPDAEEIRQMSEKYGLPVRSDEVDSDEEQVNGVGVANNVGASKYQLVGTLDDVSISDSD